jgi:mRNA interferase MazF
MVAGLGFCGGGRGVARFVAGDVVVVPFPFTDLASSKVRPAVVLATSTRNDILLCQITSRDTGHPEAVAVKMTDFASAEKLPRDSYALPHRLVTANESCVRRRAGHLQDAKLREVRDRVCAFVSAQGGDF